jgi:hypothetical protein
LRVAGAAFVTITCDGQLRGCIGFVDPIKPLAEAVAPARPQLYHSRSRFPITPEELPRLRVGVSVPPLHVVSDPRAIRVGTHGLFISHEGRHGLLLPRSPASSSGTDTFLRQTCLKAGLPGTPEAWGRVRISPDPADDGPWRRRRLRSHGAASVENSLAGPSRDSIQAVSTAVPTPSSSETRSARRFGVRRVACLPAPVDRPTHLGTGLPHRGRGKPSLSPD